MTKDQRSSEAPSYSTSRHHRLEMTHDDLEVEAEWASTAVHRHAPTSRPTYTPALEVGAWQVWGTRESPSRRPGKFTNASAIRDRSCLTRATEESV